MYYNIIINKYNIGDVYWCDFEETIRKYMNNNYSKFIFFSTIVKCNINNNDESILVDDINSYVLLYRFDNGDSFYYTFCNSKKIRDYIFHRAVLNDITLHSSSIISDVKITFHSHYPSMTPNHLLEQPRRILESKLLKHIKNANRYDMDTKYNYLSHTYNLIKYN